MLNIKMDPCNKRSDTRFGEFITLLFFGPVLRACDGFLSLFGRLLEFRVNYSFFSFSLQVP